jgi:3-methyladenine DNA glycosylase/8-oxoguanine DNA glycosylase
MDPGGEDLTAHTTIDGADIAPPHDFGFQLRHYVIAPEVREGPKLIEVVRTAAGALVKVAVTSCGTVEQPCLDLRLRSQRPLSAADVAQVRDMVMWRLGTREDLRPFYALVEGDPVLNASVKHNFGAKGKCSDSMFDAVIDVICAQNTAWRRVYSMRANLAAAFGDAFVGATRVYRASPTPEQLAGAPLDAIRACGVGYRDRYIKAVAEAVAAGFDVERLKDVPREQARQELMKLPGVGAYTADLGLIIGARRQDGMFLDVYLREALRAFYFDGERVPEAVLADFAEERWGPYRGLAWLYLTTNTEVWAQELGIDCRLRSGALSDPDRPHRRIIDVARVHRDDGLVLREQGIELGPWLICELCLFSHPVPEFLRDVGAGGRHHQDRKREGARQHDSSVHRLPLSGPNLECSLGST